MPELLICVNGHSWQDTAQPSNLEGRSSCPVCGKAAEALPSAARPAIKEQDLTLVFDPPREVFLQTDLVRVAGGTDVTPVSVVGVVKTGAVTDVLPDAAGAPTLDHPPPPKGKGPTPELP